MKKQTSKKLTTSIGIPCYFAEKNIVNVLSSLITQNEKNQTIKEILVYSDGSTDKTIMLARSIKDKRIKVIDGKKRKGMIAGMFKMFEIYKGDLFVLLNDDIKITDNSFIDHAVKPFLKEKNIGLVGGTPKPLPSRTFTERASASAYNVYDEARLKFRKGNNKYTCDGKIMVLSRKLINVLDKKQKLNEYGCVDVYIYFTCITNNLLYRYVPKAVVWFRGPENMHDFISLTARNNTNIYMLEKTFGSIVNEEYSIPKKYLYTAKAKELFKHPIPALAVFFLGLYCNYLAMHRASNFQAKWDIVTSTKNLD